MMYSMKPKLDMRLFVDSCVFTCFYKFLHDVVIKLLSAAKTKQFHDHIVQKLIKTSKYTEINKPPYIKF